MSTSGSKDYSITRADIINAALRKIGAYDQGETVPGDEVSAASLSLNLMVKEWVARGIDIWLRKEITVFLQPGTRAYSLGSDHATESLVETTLSSAAALGATTVSLTSTTGISDGDFIGIKQDDNSIHWTTIITAATTTITLATTDTASVGNKVYTYTTKAGRPQKILYAYRRDTSGHDTEVSLIGENEYRRQSNKGSSGPPVEIWYHPTLTNGTMYTWPVDGGKTFDKLIIISQSLPDDFDTQADNPEFPIEWGNTLVWGLAAELASEYGIPEREQGRLWSVAEAKLGEMMAYDTENASVVFTMSQ